MTPELQLRELQQRLRQCRLCPTMIGPVVVGEPVCSPVMLIGQAPGEKEGKLGRPFAWTAGKTLFRWFETCCDANEATVRSRIYMTAVCRCFPGKKPRGGDRVPNRAEIENCSRWLRAESKLLRPRLLIPVGKLAISRILPVSRLDEIVGTCQRREWQGREVDVIALPHPSGASTWHRTMPGRELLQQALRSIAGHPAWRQAIGGPV